ncbi:MAG: UvrD-helicase domain-containing protein [Candidatus Pacebacteria bacterium]|nr:UvrD-helicase domain-containing protein [Candidatus Paceibacterota bacterium]MBP9866674.1 UvrD-helicase domain-containing protein [Candidatus Paceibacterota bacterium]
MSHAHLNEKQQEAVLCTEGPLLIIAGAGAGKTKTITERIVEIIKKGTDPRSILAVTFTNKAAKEMRERIIGRLEEEHIIEKENPYHPTPVIKTFHSLGLMMLSEYGERMGLLRHPTILDSSDSLSIIKKAVEQLGIDPKVNDPSKIRSIISREKGDFVNQQAYKQKVATAQMDIVASVWHLYDEELKRQKAVDFDDLIVRAVHMLEEHTDIRKQYQERFVYVHVDEYQDTNGAQYAFVKLLVNEKNNNICAVGDTDQNIYSWRGANIRNIMNFEKDFPGTKTILLEENYRSTGNILSLANTAIKKNTVRQDKNLFTSQGVGDKIDVVPCWDEGSESEWLAERCKTLIQEGQDPKNIAVLYRANFQSRILEEAFIRANVTYNLLGTKFFERKEIKDVMSYLRSAVNRLSQADLRRVFETPKRGIGKVTVAKIFAGEDIPTSAKLKIQKVYDFLDMIMLKLETEPLSHVIQMIIVDSGMEKEMLEGSSEDKERLENARELVSLTLSYDHTEGINILTTFLEETSLQSDQDNDTKEKNGVRLMTIHASKGLEFDHVFVVGLEQDLFPHKNIGNRKRSKEEEEEERRLFYVAVTRARKHLYLSYAELRTIFGQKQINAPSEFLEDVPEESKELHDLYYKQNGGSIVYI